MANPQTNATHTAPGTAHENEEVRDSSDRSRRRRARRGGGPAERTPIASPAAARRCQAGDVHRPQPSHRDLVADSRDERPLTLNPYEYTAKGRCVRHPHVRLRMKKVFGAGWKVLLSACPHCCATIREDLYRMQLAERRGSGESRHSSHDASVTKGSIATASITASSRASSQAPGAGMEQSPSRGAEPLHQRKLAVRHEEEAHQQKGSRDCGPQLGGDSRHSCQDASVTKGGVTATASTTASSQASSTAPEGTRGAPAPPPRPHQRAGLQAVKMQYIDEDGRRGIYDGGLDARLLPHGRGTLVYADDGTTRQGEWRGGRYLWRGDGRSRSESRPRAPAKRSGGEEGLRKSRPGSRKGTPSRGSSGENDQRRRPSLTGECYH